jgi:hypothetical protein
VSKDIENTIASEIVALIKSSKEDSAEHIEILPLEVGVSIRIFKMPVMRIVYGKRKQYISVNPICKRALNDFTPIKTETIKSDRWIRVLFNSQDELEQMHQLFSRIYDEAYFMLSVEPFGCCYRYEECSDEKKCIHPDQLIARGCAYRAHLEDGRIFYGKNKTI